jgi:hypothetical protein
VRRLDKAITATTIAKKTLLDAANVRRDVKALEDMGLIHYKPVLRDGAGYTEPPWPFDTVNPAMWMENHCFASGMGIEMDWMTFYYSIMLSSVPNAVGVQELFTIYRRTCTGNPNGTCTTDHGVPWSGLVDNAFVHFGSNPANPNFQRFETPGLIRASRNRKEVARASSVKECYATGYGWLEVRFTIAVVFDCPPEPNGNMPRGRVPRPSFTQDTPRLRARTPAMTIRSFRRSLGTAEMPDPRRIRADKRRRMLGVFTTQSATRANG